MKIGVIGCGYVGLVTGTCIANRENEVTFYDISRERLERLKKNDIYISEPGLNELFLQNKQLGFLKISENIDGLIKNSNVIIIAVNTPPKNTGECNLDNLLDVIEILLQNKDIDNKSIIIKSTISVGTTRIISDYVNKSGKNINLFYNPEFLSQGNAVNDFLKPNKIVVGYENTNCFDLMHKIYSNCDLPKDKFIFTNYETAEMIKYSCNCFLAMRVSYINLISQIANKFNADILSIEKSMKSDSRIGSHYLSSGLGFGGSCLYKDLKALDYICKQNEISSNLLDDIIKINDKQVKIATEKIASEISNKDKIVIFGLTFKENTNDTRFSQSLELIKNLIDLGYENIYVYEPLKIELPDLKITFVKDAYQCVENTKAIVVCNNNHNYNDLDWDKIAKKVNSKKIFDFRNILNKTVLQNKGFNITGFNGV